MGVFTKKRERQQRLVVTFYITAAAMAMERLCKDKGIPGRLIPVPRSLTSDCGIAWCMSPGDRDTLLAVLKGSGVETAEMTETEL